MEERAPLTPAEWKLMEALWSEGPQTITRLTAALAEGTGWTKHTVISFLNRMEAKGAVAYREEGRARVYAPVYPREEATAQEAERFLDRVFGGSLGLLVNAMVRGQTLSQQEITELEDILRRAKGEGSDA